MKKKNCISNYKSKCCNSGVRTVMSPDFIGDNIKEMRVGTCYFVCKNCGLSCDVQYNEQMSNKMNLKDVYSNRQMSDKTDIKVDWSGLKRVLGQIEKDFRSGRLYGKKKKRG